MPFGLPDFNQSEGRPEDYENPKVHYLSHQSLQIDPNLFNIEPMKGYGEAVLESAPPGQHQASRPAIGSPDPFLVMREDGESNQQPGQQVWAASSDRTGPGVAQRQGSPGRLPMVREEE